MGTLRDVFIGLGANLGDREGSLRSALELLSKSLGPSKLVSSIYHSKALIIPGTKVQPDFLNAAAVFESDLSPEDILSALHDAEKDLGRSRDIEKRWEPRTIDLDLLFCGSEVISNEKIKVPHPELHKRDFVLAPLAEIAPTFLHPVLKKTLSELYEEYFRAGNCKFVYRYSLRASP